MQTPEADDGLEITLGPSRIGPGPAGFEAALEPMQRGAAARVDLADTAEQDVPPGGIPVPYADALVAEVCGFLNDANRRHKALAGRYNAGFCLTLAVALPAALAAGWLVFGLPGPLATLLAFVALIPIDLALALLATFLDRRFMERAHGEFLRRFGQDTARRTRSLWLLSVLWTPGRIAGRLLLRFARQQPLWNMPAPDGRPASRFAKARALVAMLDASGLPTALGRTVQTLWQFVLPPLIVWSGWKLFSWPPWACWTVGIVAAAAAFVIGSFLFGDRKRGAFRRFARPMSTFVPPVAMDAVAGAILLPAAIPDNGAWTPLAEWFPIEDPSRKNELPHGRLAARPPAPPPADVRMAVDEVLQAMLRRLARQMSWSRISGLVAHALAPIGIAAALMVGLGWIWWQAAFAGIGAIYYLGWLRRSLLDRARDRAMRQVAGQFNQRFPQASPIRDAALQYVGRLGSERHVLSQWLANQLHATRVAQPIARGGPG